MFKPNLTSFENLENQCIMRTPGTLNHCPFSVKGLNNCDIFVLDRTSIFYFRNCNNSTLHTGPISAAIYVENCRNCTISICCHRLRVFNCQNIRLYVSSVVAPNVDRSEGIVFAPYNFTYPGLEQQLRQSRMEKNANNWSAIVKLVKERKDCSVLEVQEFSMDRIELEGIGPGDNALAIPDEYLQQGLRVN